jgi:hypothetical protein
MALVTLPFPLTAGTKARGSHVLGNDTAITGQVNANLDDANYKNAAMTLSSKAVPGSATNTIIGADAITESKVADQAIQAEHQKNDAAGSEGLGMPRNELYTGAGSDDAGGYPKTNINASRKQQGGKTVWAYFNIVIGSIGTDYLIDNSIDWRQRLIFICAEGTVNSAGSPRTDLPGGGSDNAISFPFWSTPGTISSGGNAGLFYSENGQATGAGAFPGLDLAFGVGTPDQVRFFARSTDGALMARATAITATGVSVNAIIICSPDIATV